MRDPSGAAQKAAHISALNFGWVWVSVMPLGCGPDRRGSITPEVIAPRFVTGVI